MINLVISDPEGTTTVVPFTRDEITIGRKEGNTIRLTERNISREHCRVQRANGGYSIHDLGSYNGVTINGQRVEGVSPLKPGDQLQIGDYSVKLEDEVAVANGDGIVPDVPVETVRPRADSVEEDEPTRVAPIPRPTPPARLVVLSSPLAGAEFTLPERGDVRIGRDQGLEIPLDHRSVSRVHAKIACEGDQLRIIDQGSVNGVAVNGEKVSDARLVAGDVVELGDVALRFVAGSEPYVFDPAEARSFVARKRGRQRRGQYIAAAVVSAALAVAYLLFAPARAPQSMVAAPSVEPVPAPGAAPPNAAPQAEPQAAPQAAPDDGFSRFVASCREAIAGGRFAEAMAHANAALKARPSAADALDCERLARANDEQEQIFVRGKAALAVGDAKAAWNELSQLSPTGARRLHPDVVQVVEAVASKRLDGAEIELRARPTAALKLAESVLALSPLSPALRERAKSIIEREHAAATDPSPRPAPAARRAPEARSATHDRPAMEVAKECLARGDNPCVIRALVGKARTAQELGLLIETYLALGDSAQADKNITTYLARFPTARRADAYRAMRPR